MRYKIGSAKWTMEINDKTNAVNPSYIGTWAEKYYTHFTDKKVGYNCTADFYDKNNDIICLYVKKENNGISLNPMVFEFNGKEIKMTNFIEF